MIIGLNADIEFEGKTYHVQTEDSGRNNPVIVTLLFHAGAILAKLKKNYADRVEAENLPVIVKELMSAQHKQMILDLKAGRIVPSQGRSGLEQDGQQSLTGSGPHSRVIPNEKKSLDDMILDYLAVREKDKKP